MCLYLPIIAASTLERQRLDNKKLALSRCIEPVLNHFNPESIDKVRVYGVAEI